MERTMHRLLSALDSWREDLEGQLAALDEQQLGFLAWELRRVAEAVAQAERTRVQRAGGHARLAVAGGQLAQQQEEPQVLPPLARAK